VPRIRRYQQWLAATRGPYFPCYEDLWRWSTTQLDVRWQSIWDYFALQSPTPPSTVLPPSSMPGARWLTGAQVNYAQQVFRHVARADAACMPALLCHTEKSLTPERPEHTTWPELHRRASSMTLALQGMGVQPGDRVAAYLPNGCVPCAIT